MQPVKATSISCLASLALAAMGAAFPAWAGDPAYGVWTQYNANANAGSGVGASDIYSVNTTLVQATVPTTFTFSGSRGGATVGSATTNASASSFYGALNLSASGTAVAGTDGAGSSFSGEVGGFPTDYFRDQFTIQSSTLAAGTLVNIGFDINYTSSASDTPDPNAYNPASFVDSEFILGTPSTAVTVFDKSYGVGAYNDVFTVALAVGQTYRIEGSMNGFGYANSEDAGVNTSYAINGDANLHFDTLTDGVSLITASGHDYSSVAGVPEPTSWMPMFLGFGGIGAALRSRRHLALARPNMR